MNTIACPSRSINSTNVPADLAYKSFVTKYAWLNETRWIEMVINLCVECSHFNPNDRLINTSSWQRNPIQEHLSDYVPILLIIIAIDYKCL